MSQFSNNPPHISPLTEPIPLSPNPSLSISRQISFLPDQIETNENIIAIWLFYHHFQENYGQLLISKNLTPRNVPTFKELYKWFDIGNRHNNVCNDGLLNHSPYDVDNSISQSMQFHFKLLFENLFNLTTTTDLSNNQDGQNLNSLFASYQADPNNQTFNNSIIILCHLIQNYIKKSHQNLNEKDKKFNSQIRETSSSVFSATNTGTNTNLTNTQCTGSNNTSNQKFSSLNRTAINERISEWQNKAIFSPIQMEPISCVTTNEGDSMDIDGSYYLNENDNLSTGIRNISHSYPVNSNNNNRPQILLPITSSNSNTWANCSSRGSLASSVTLGNNCLSPLNFNASSQELSCSSFSGYGMSNYKTRPDFSFWTSIKSKKLIQRYFSSIDLTSNNHWFGDGLNFLKI